MLTPEEIAALRAAHYNATLTAIVEIHEDLRILRVVPDRAIPPFLPGQYTTLGIGNWEPRCPATESETIDDDRLRRVAQRSYSVSCSMVDERGRVQRVGDAPYLEFYVALVRRAEDHPPAVTPRLFALRAGDRLHVGERMQGRYTLTGVDQDDDVVFLATGTGEAPHNAMLAELIAAGHRGRLASVVCCRWRKDFAYLAAHAALMKLASRYRYAPLTTREPENVDAARSDFVGKQYIQDFVAAEGVAKLFVGDFDFARAHWFLCGNPEMIGAPRSGEPPAPGGTIALLLSRGVPAERIHFERYW